MKAKKERPEGKGWTWDKQKEKWFRVRKLTPTECFRLMGMRKRFIDLITFRHDDKKKQISESQQYKMAGNSIVVDVMYYCFENLFFPEDNDTEVAEPTLF